MERFSVSGAFVDYDELLALFEPPEWHAAAVCRGRRDLFFVGHGESVEAARALCTTCPSQQPCLDEALADSGLLGVWGGTTAGERVKIRRARRQQAA